MNYITIDHSVISEFTERYKVYNIVYKYDVDGIGELEFTTNIDTFRQLVADTIKPSQIDIDIDCLQSIFEEQTSEKLQQIITTIKKIINDRNFNDIIGF